MGELRQSCVPPAWKPGWFVANEEPATVHPHTVRQEHLQHFADELDAISLRMQKDGSASEADIAAIFVEHEVECVALERAEQESEAELMSEARRP